MEQTATTQTKGQKKKRTPILVALLICCIAVAVFMGLRIQGHFDRLPRSWDTTPYASVLTSHEVKEWANEKVQNGKGYVQLSTRVEMEAGGRVAPLRLINPPYSDYAFEIAIYLPETDETVYRSERLNPGTVLERVELSTALPAGEHTANVKYTFYDGWDVEQGMYDVNIDLIVQ